MSGRNELQIPHAAEHDPNSFELLRVWVANRGQHVSLTKGGCLAGSRCLGYHDL